MPRTAVFAAQKSDVVTVIILVILVPALPAYSSVRLLLLAHQSCKTAEIAGFLCPIVFSKVFVKDDLASVAASAFEKSRAPPPCARSNLRPSVRVRRMRVPSSLTQSVFCEHVEVTVVRRASVGRRGRGRDSVGLAG